MGAFLLSTRCAVRYAGSDRRVGVPKVDKVLVREVSIGQAQQREWFTTDRLGDYKVLEPEPVRTGRRAPRGPTAGVRLANRSRARRRTRCAASLASLLRRAVESHWSSAASTGDRAAADRRIAAKELGILAEKLAFAAQRLAGLCGAAGSTARGHGRSERRVSGGLLEGKRRGGGYWPNGATHWDAFCSDSRSAWPTTGKGSARPGATRRST
jgi:hypothetical protein